MEAINQEIVSVRIVKVKPKQTTKSSSHKNTNKTSKAKKPKPKGRSKCRGKKIRCVHTPDTAPSAVTITTYKPINDLTVINYIQTENYTYRTPAQLYRSVEWRNIRKSILSKYGRICMKCGLKSFGLDENGISVRICIDHIKPVSKYPELVFDEDNLQVLCSTCNKQKSYTDETDYRPK